MDKSDARSEVIASEIQYILMQLKDRGTLDESSSIAANLLAHVWTSVFSKLGGVGMVDFAAQCFNRFADGICEPVSIERGSDEAGSFITIRPVRPASDGGLN